MHKYAIQSDFQTVLHCLILLQYHCPYRYLLQLQRCSSSAVNGASNRSSAGAVSSVMPTTTSQSLLLLSTLLVLQFFDFLAIGISLLFSLDTVPSFEN